MHCLKATRYRASKLGCFIEKGILKREAYKRIWGEYILTITGIKMKRCLKAFAASTFGYNGKELQKVGWRNKKHWVYTYYNTYSYVKGVFCEKLKKFIGAYVHTYICPFYVSAHLKIYFQFLDPNSFYSCTAFCVLMCSAISLYLCTFLTNLQRDLFNLFWVTIGSYLKVKSCNHQWLLLADIESMYICN